MKKKKFESKREIREGRVRLKEGERDWKGGGVHKMRRGLEREGKAKGSRAGN